MPEKKPPKLAKKRKYVPPQMKKHNEIVENTSGFSVAGPPMPGPPAGAQASPTVPGTTVF